MQAPLPRDGAGRLDVAALGERLREARERLRPWVRETPTVYSFTFSHEMGGREAPRDTRDGRASEKDVFLKLENLQRTGSFKVRGALNKVLGLSEADRRRGLVAASAGNHAQGVALAARLTGCTATIVMPEATALVKVRATEEYGARVLLFGASWDEAHARAIELAEAEGRTLIHPFDDLEVILGQGTAALEILEEVPAVREVVVPVGGGGLLAGCALALAAERPDVRLVGVQAAGAASMLRSLEAGTPTRVEHPRTLAEGIRVGRVGTLTLEIVRELRPTCVAVGEDELARAVVETMQKSRVVAEAAGVAGIAALGLPEVASDGPVCVLVSGGNIDLNQLARLIESGLAEAGFTHLVRLRLPDLPGQLHRITSVLAESRSNVLDVQHHRAGWKVPVGFVDVEILIETRHATQGADLERRLAAEGFEVRRG